MAQLFTPPYQTTLDANGDAISGARLYFYVSGSTTPAPVYATAALSAALPSPVIADAAGRHVPIYLDGSVKYRVKVTDAAGVMIRDVDPIGDSFGADLLAPTGFSLIKHKRPETGTYARTAAQLERIGGLSSDGVSVHHWIPPELDVPILTANNGTDLKPYIQAAFDNAPLGCNLIFCPGDYRIFSSLTLRRQMNLVGQDSRLQPYFGSNVTDNALNILLEAASNNQGDARRMRIDGLIIAPSFGVRHGLYISNAAPLASNLHMEITRCGLASGAAVDGCALVFNGLLTQAHTVQGCEIANTIKVQGAADGITIRENIIGGTRAGVIVDPSAGAFQTRIKDNLIVTRDNGVIIYNGSQVVIDGNQFEQAAALNQAPIAAHIVVYPQTYGSRRIHIINNNFGAGGNIPTSIDVRGTAGTRKTVEDLIVDNNTFNTGSGGYDVLLGEGVYASRFGPRVTLRGNRGGTAVDADGNVTPYPNTVDARLSVYCPNAVGTMGISMFQTDNVTQAITFANGWNGGAGFTFTKSETGELRFTGTWTGGTLTDNTLIGTLPIGFRPAAEARFIASTNAGIATFTCGANGEIRAKGAVPATPVYLNGAAPITVAIHTHYEPDV